MSEGGTQVVPLHTSGLILSGPEVITASYRRVQSAQGKEALEQDLHTSFVCVSCEVVEHHWHLLHVVAVHGHCPCPLNRTSFGTAVLIEQFLLPIL